MLAAHVLVCLGPHQWLSGFLENVLMCVDMASILSIFVR